MAVDKTTAAALLEFEQLGRFSDQTREALTKIVEPSESKSDDDDQDDAKASARSTSTSKGVSK
jgi:hypothetical protein